MTGFSAARSPAVLRCASPRAAHWRSAGSAKGHIRRNGERGDRQDQPVAAGDVLTLPLPRKVTVIETDRACLTRGGSPQAKLKPAIAGLTVARQKRIAGDTRPTEEAPRAGGKVPTMTYVVTDASHQVQVHRLRRGLSGRLLLRRRDDARHQPVGVHRLRRVRARNARPRRSCPTPRAARAVARAQLEVSAEWPNITEKKDPPEDADAFKGSMASSTSTSRRSPAKATDSRAPGGAPPARYRYDSRPSFARLLGRGGNFIANLLYNALTAALALGDRRIRKAGPRQQRH